MQTEQKLLSVPPRQMDYLSPGELFCALTQDYINELQADARRVLKPNNPASHFINRLPQVGD